MISPKKAKEIEEKDGITDEELDDMIEFYETLEEVSEEFDLKLLENWVVSKVTMYNTMKFHRDNK